MVVSKIVAERLKLHIDELEGEEKEILVRAEMLLNLFEDTAAQLELRVADLDCSEPHADEALKSPVVPTYIPVTKPTYDTLLASCQRDTETAKREAQQAQMHSLSLQTRLLAMEAHTAEAKAEARRLQAQVDNLQTQLQASEVRAEAANRGPPINEMCTARFRQVSSARTEAAEVLTVMDLHSPQGERGLAQIARQSTSLIMGRSKSHAHPMMARSIAVAPQITAEPNYAVSNPSQFLQHGSHVSTTSMMSRQATPRPTCLSDHPMLNQAVERFRLAFESDVDAAQKAAGSGSVPCKLPSGNSVAMSSSPASPDRGGSYVHGVTAQAGCTARSFSPMYTTRSSDASLALANLVQQTPSRSFPRTNAPLVRMTSPTPPGMTSPPLVARRRIPSPISSSQVGRRKSVGNVLQTHAQVPGTSIPVHSNSKPSGASCRWASVRATSPCRSPK